MLDNYNCPAIYNAHKRICRVLNERPALSAAAGQIRLGASVWGGMWPLVNHMTSDHRLFDCWCISTGQTDRQTDSFIPPIYNTIWWGRVLLRHKHMSLSKEPPYNNDKQWITLYIKYTYRPVMWVRKLLNVTYWTGRSGKWLCYSLKTVQTVDRNEWCTDDEMRLNIYHRITIKTRDIFDTNMFEKSGSMG